MKRFPLIGLTLLVWACAIRCSMAQQVTEPPKNLGLDSFYTKYVNADGYPIVASEKVNDYALKEAAYLVNTILRTRPDVRTAMIQSGSRLIVMAYNEYTTDLPEQRNMTPFIYVDRFVLTQLLIAD